MNDKLKPCPFCGATPHSGLGKSRTCQLHGEPLADFIVWCPHGCSRINSGNRDRSIATWNTRLADPRIAEMESEVARLRTNISHCQGRFLNINIILSSGGTKREAIELADMAEDCCKGYLKYGRGNTNDANL